MRDFVKPALPSRPALGRWGLSPETSKEDKALLDNASLFELYEPSEWHTLPGWRAARKPRTPSIRAQIAAAEKAGKIVTSITLPDGTMLQLGEPSPAEARNPWLADLAKMRKQ